MPKRRILGWPISGPYSTPGLTEPARRASSQGDPRRHRPCPGKSSLGAIQRPLISRAGERVGELGPREADAWSADSRAQVGPSVPQGTQGGDGAAALPHPISRPTRSGSPRGPLPTRRGHSGPGPPSPRPREGLWGQGRGQGHSQGLTCPGSILTHCASASAPDGALGTTHAHHPPTPGDSSAPSGARNPQEAAAARTQRKANEGEASSTISVPGHPLHPQSALSQGPVLSGNRR
ncbi:collagen alpha-1(I) chain-like [Equus asinus]|uniref:collagen alpha-1(I) chain-like n=1 Tax=Equus asinus TaxID=9793 RepID=UPI0038F63016